MCTSTAGAIPNEIRSAIESSWTPNGLVAPTLRATNPSAMSSRIETHSRAAAQPNSCRNASSTEANRPCTGGEMLDAVTRPVGCSVTAGDAGPGRQITPPGERRHRPRPCAEPSAAQAGPAVGGSAGSRHGGYTPASGRPSPPRTLSPMTSGAVAVSVIRGRTSSGRSSGRIRPGDPVTTRRAARRLAEQAPLGLPTGRQGDLAAFVLVALSAVGASFRACRTRSARSGRAAVDVTSGGREDRHLEPVPSGATPGCGHRHA